MPVGSEAILTEAREAVTHGCCCKCCSVRAEIWLCFAIDITSILGLALEIPNWRVVPARFHATDVYTFYLVLSVFSASLILYAQLSTNAWPRRALVRFMILKLAIFVVVVMGFFTVWPTAGRSQNGSARMILRASAPSLLEAMPTRARRRSRCSPR